MVGAGRPCGVYWVARSDYEALIRAGFQIPTNMTTDFDNFDPEQVQVSNAKLTVGQTALFVRVARSDYEALIQLLVERTSLTVDEIIRLPNDDRFMRLVERMRQGAEQAVTVAQLEKIAPPESEPPLHFPTGPTGRIDVPKLLSERSTGSKRTGWLETLAGLCVLAALGLAAWQSVQHYTWWALWFYLATLLLLLNVMVRAGKR